MKSVNPTVSRKVTEEMYKNKTIPVGGIGKSGYVRMEFELDNNGKSILRNLDRRVPLIVQQALYFDEQMPELPCVYILSSGGPNVDGDRYRQEIILKEGSCAHISTGAATKIASMRHDHSALYQFISLAEGAYLEYIPEPIIPCRNARYFSETEIVVAPSATLFYSEIFLCGRKYHGEVFAYDLLSLYTHAEREDGQQLFREKMVIQPDKDCLTDTGKLHDYDVFANVIVLTPPESADELYCQTDAFIDNEKKLAAGITRLPNRCGLQYKVLGGETQLVKSAVREFCSKVRTIIKGRPVPKEFPWR